MNTNAFALRHIGPNQEDQNLMLQTLGVDSLDQLIYETIPDDIRLKKPLHLEEPMTEYEYLLHIHKLSLKNKVYKTYIGLGYHPTVLPAVIQRNVLENPGWYTAYTPYQAEIAQGRLEALLNFQTMVIDLTGMEMANAALLDERTAAAEAHGPHQPDHEQRTFDALSRGSSEGRTLVKVFPGRRGEGGLHST